MSLNNGRVFMEGFGNFRNLVEFLVQLFFREFEIKKLKIPPKIHLLQFLNTPHNLQNSYHVLCTEKISLEIYCLFHITYIFFSPIIKCLLDMSGKRNVFFSSGIEKEKPEKCLEGSQKFMADWIV